MTPRLDSPERSFKIWQTATFVIVLIGFLVFIYAARKLGESISFRRDVLKSRVEGSRSSQNLGFQSLLIAEFVDESSESERIASEALLNAHRELTVLLESAATDPDDLSFDALADLFAGRRPVGAQEMRQLARVAVGYSPSTGADAMNALDLKQVSNHDESPIYGGTNPFDHVESNATEPGVPSSGLDVFTFIPHGVAPSSEALNSNRYVQNCVVFSTIACQILRTSEAFAAIESEASHVYCVAPSGSISIARIGKENNRASYSGVIDQFSAFSDRAIFFDSKGLWTDDELNIKKVYESGLYIDLAGDGLVRTVSLFFKGPTPATSGALCCDLKVASLKDVIRDVDLGPLPFARDFHVEIASVDDAPETLSNDTLRAIHASIQKKPDEYVARITKVVGEGGPIFTVPIGKREIAYFDFSHELWWWGGANGMFIITIVVFFCVTFGIYNFRRVSMQMVNVVREKSTIMDRLRVGLVTIDSKYSIVYLNPVAKEMLGGKPVGQSLLRYFKSDTRKAFEDTVASGSVDEYPGEVRADDGKVIKCILLVTSLGEPSAMGALTMVLFIPSKDLEVIIASNYIHTISHAIKTPLQSIILLTDRLRRRSQIGKFDQYYALMQQEVGEFRTLITNLVRYAQLDLIESIEPNLERCNLARVFRAVASPFRQAMLKQENNEIVLYEKLPDRLTISVDIEMIKVVFNNLISNALKYTESGSIGIELRSEGRDVHFYCTDTGCGIPEAERRLVFDQFYRGESAAVQSQEGIGIGLYVTASYVKLHGGKIECYDGPNGAGTTVHIRLPKRRGDS